VSEPPRGDYISGMTLLLAIVLTAFQGRKVWVYTPPAYDAKHAPYDLVVLFDGETYVSDIPTPAILDELIAAKKIPPVVAVLVDTSQNRIGDLANHQAFADALARDLIPWARGKWRITNDPRRVVVGGSSAGGLAAAYVAYRHPEVFGNVLSQSGAYWRGNEGASEPGEWLTAQFRASAKLPIRFYIEVGALETHTVVNGLVFIETNRRLRDVLRAKGYEVDYVEVPGAHHEEKHWGSKLGEGLERSLRR
jgi:enterochelin esterase family protein